MNPKNYFEQRIEQNKLLLKKLISASFLLAMLRLAVFFAALLFIYLFWDNTAGIAVSAIAGFAGFLFLVARYSDVKNKRDYHQNLKDLNLRELSALSGDCSQFDSGKEFVGHKNIAHKLKARFYAAHPNA